MSPALTLRVLPGADEVAALRAEQFLAAVRDKPDLVFLGNTGRTPRAMYRAIAGAGVDLSRIRLRVLDCWVMSPPVGFDSLRHPASFTGYLEDAFLRHLSAERRPRDVRLLPEDLTTCTAVADALAAQPEQWQRPVHPRTGEPGAEIVIAPEAVGVLARIRTACEGFERELRASPPDLASLGVGQRPYPHMAFNNGPFTRLEAETHLTCTDLAVRLAEAAVFGGTDRVPQFALTVGPATILRSRTLWVTATGAAKAAAVAEMFADPTEKDHELRGSMAYALGHPDVSLVIDEAAAAEMLGHGRDVLARRYAAAGIELRFA